MTTAILGSAAELGREAAAAGAEMIRKALKDRGEANVILATGASQFEVLKHLVKSEAIDWSCVTIFHLDEYIGLHADHPASFRKYLRERFMNHVPRVAEFIEVDGNSSNLAQELQRLQERIDQHPIDVAFIGIGENGHLAFNDPPADFETEDAFIEVQLDEACRQQQYGEGWFPSLDAVPRNAISMSIPQIMKSKTLVVSVPDERKASAVQGALEGPLTNMCPASMLREHPNCLLFLDPESSKLLT
ncbi:MAG: glucosamine-6-phosphate deaminase [Saprospiraceae bacterium]|nr:glucosamine-6-phosphate deaminase [Saprospiraceae bacterium]